MQHQYENNQLSSDATVAKIPPTECALRFPSVHITKSSAVTSASLAHKIPHPVFLPTKSFQRVVAGWSRLESHLCASTVREEFASNVLRRKLQRGPPTFVLWMNQGPGFSSPDIILVNAKVANSFDLNKLNFDHFPVLMKWIQKIGYENQTIEIRPNYRKA